MILQCFNVKILFRFKKGYFMLSNKLNNILLILLLGFLGACSGNKQTPVNQIPVDENKTGKSIPASSDTNFTLDYSTQLNYDYNNKESAFYQLLPLYVNDYETEQNRFNYAKEHFEDDYELYVSNLLSTARAFDTLPSYAPRGDKKSLLISVENGKIDYSAYSLPSDINLDGAVNFADEALLKEALKQDSSDTKYDLNQDGNVDTKDLIYLISRLGIEIHSFDFYTKEGKKLDIESRSYSQARSFSYIGTQTEVMLVPKDINGVSGFSSGLSDISTLWYVGLKKNNAPKHSLRAEGLDAVSPERIAFIRDALNYIIENPEAYLLGWMVSIKFRTPGSAYLDLDSQGMLDMDTSFFNPLEAKIKHHFKDTTLKKETKRLLEKNRYIFQIGAGRNTPDAIVDGNWNWDFDYGSVITHTKAKRKIIKVSHTINGHTIFTSSLVHASSVYYTSKADKTLSGFIKKDSQPIKEHGTVTIKRIGPDPQDETYGTSLDPNVDGYFTFKKKIPFGAYEIEYERECGLCKDKLASEYIFLKNKESDYEEFSIEQKEKTVQLRVVDQENQPVSGKHVKIVADGCVHDDTMQLAVSDSEGRVEFNNVPIGTYHIYIQDKENSSIQFCENYKGDIKDEPLWDISISFQGRIHNYEKVYKNVKIPSIKDTPYDLVTAIADHIKYPYPYSITNGLVLAESNWFSKSDPETGGNTLYYYPNGTLYMANPGYCFELEELRTLIEDDGDSGVDCADPEVTPSWDQINTIFNTTQASALENHEAFTLEDTGLWINAQGTSSLRVVFTPSK